MRVIIAGPRYVGKTHEIFDDYDLVKRAIMLSGFRPSVVVSGRAIGVDRLGELWADERRIRIDSYPVTKDDYAKYGSKRAPYLRNVRMAENADALIAVWDGASRGTSNMIEIAKKKGLLVFVYRIDHGAGSHWVPQEGLFTDPEIRRITEEVCRPRNPDKDIS